MAIRARKATTAAVPRQIFLRLVAPDATTVGKTPLLAIYVSKKIIATINKNNMLRCNISGWI
jgi:hypothetical protein